MVVQVASSTFVVKALLRLSARVESSTRNEPGSEGIELRPILDGDGEIHVGRRTPGGQSEHMGKKDIACCRPYEHVIDLLCQRFFRHGTQNIDRDMVDWAVSSDRTKRQ